MRSSWRRRYQGTARPARRPCYRPTVARILHISDLHFGRPHCRSARKAVHAVLDATCPDAMVVSGDIVQHYESRSSWREAARFFESVDIPTLIVPGNHDIPRLAAWRRLGDPFERFRELGHSPDGTLQLEGLTVVGIATPKVWTLDLGHVDTRQLQWAR